LGARSRNLRYGGEEGATRVIHPDVRGDRLTESPNRRPVTR
jgi:hypothetical protein